QSGPPGIATGQANSSKAAEVEGQAPGQQRDKFAEKDGRARQRPRQRPQQVALLALPAQRFGGKTEAAQGNQEGSDDGKNDHARKADQGDALAEVGIVQYGRVRPGDGKLNGVAGERERRRGLDRSVGLGGSPLL